MNFADFLLIAENSVIKPGWQNVADANAIPIALTGMLIVFSALLLISFFIASLPKILSYVEPYLPEAEEHHQSPSPAESLPQDEEYVIAAIGFILHAEMQNLKKT